MDWHHSNTRQGGTLLVFNRVIAQNNKLPASEPLARRGAFVLKQSLEVCKGVFACKPIYRSSWQGLTVKAYSTFACVHACMYVCVRARVWMCVSYCPGYCWRTTL